MGDQEMGAATAFMEQCLTHARAGEALIAAVSVLTAAVTSITRIAEVDEALIPEIAAAIEQLTAVGESLQQAFVVTSTRLELAREKIMFNLEGGGDAA